MSAPGDRTGQDKTDQVSWLVAMLANHERWEALRSMAPAEARDELARQDAGLEPATVGEAIEAARQVLRLARSSTPAP